MAMLFALTILFLSEGCTQNNEVKETRFMMGTLVEFVVIEEDKDKALQAIQQAAVTMQKLSDELTIYGEQANTVKAFNQSVANTPYDFPQAINDLLKQALEIDQQSRHAFSPSLGSLSLLWGFSDDIPPTHPPSTVSIEKLQQHSLQCLRFEQHWQRSNADCQLDLGGIAKGFIIDRGIDVLKQHGVGNAMINAGGDIRMLGTHGDRLWNIGIRHPRKAGQVIAKLSLSGDHSIVTSGDYERFFIDHGKRYHHILDPATGWPATASQSSTVMAPNAMLADAWSTALFVLGAKGIPLLEQVKIEGMVVDANGNIHATRRFKQYLQLSD